ncbi:MAG: hypothetical protein H6907_21740, partial [Hyphomicrobiales bacterium]|nr:hypothetical protein [Hyphomicrobiales bacterium]
MGRPPRRSEARDAAAPPGKAFVNRDKPIATLQAAALRLRDRPADRAEVLVFHGIGGQGKTMLCRHVAGLLRADPAFADLHVGLVDLHGESRREPALASLWLRNALAKSGRIAFTAFDMAFAIYWKEAFPDLPLPTMDLPWLDRDGADLSGHAISDLATTTVNELLQDIVTGVPFVGMTLRRLTGWAIHRGREKYIMGSNDTLKTLFKDDELRPPHELVTELPYILARDLAAHLKRHPEDRFVILVDEYERVLPSGGASVLRRENPFDRAFRDAVVETDGALFVFFS